MIIWINGPFGAGKTTLSELLVDRLPGAMIFDPEEVGFLVRATVPPAPNGDFQDIPVWRSLTVAAATQIARAYQQDLIVPMTLVHKPYLEEIFDGLAAAGLGVRHFFLTLDEDLLRRRITEQVIVPENTGRDAEVRQWRLDQVKRCLAASGDMPPATVFLDSGATEPEALADTRRGEPAELISFDPPPRCLHPCHPPGRHRRLHGVVVAGSARLPGARTDRTEVRDRRRHTGEGGWYRGVS